MEHLPDGRSRKLVGDMLSSKKHEPHETRADCLKYLLDDTYASASKVRLVLDNLKTHTPAALSETFPFPEALRLAKKIEWHDTPLHGSWLTMVEIEVSVLVHQCLKRRIGEIGQLRKESAAWEQARNTQKATVQWRFTLPMRG